MTVFQQDSLLNEANSYTYHEINSVSATFDGEEEYDFQTYRQDTALLMGRLALVLLGLMAGVFFLVDVLLVPNHRFIMGAIRFGLILPVALLGLTLSYSSKFQQHTGLLSLAAIWAYVAGICGMLMFLPASAAHIYFIGILLVLMILFGLLRENFLKTIGLGAVIVLTYNLSALFAGTLPGKDLLIHNLFLVFGLLIGGVQSYQLNVQSRQLFWSLRSPLNAQDNIDPLPMPEENFELDVKISVGRVDEEIPVLKPIPEERAALEILPRVSDEDGASPDKPITPPLKPILGEADDPRDADRELKEAGALFHLFMERISDVVWFADPEGRFMYMSPSCERLWGYGNKEILKKSFRDILTKDSYEYFMAELRAVGRYGAGALRPLELEIVCHNRVIKTGETLALVFKDHPVYGNGIIGVVRDITSRQKTEAELRRFNVELEGIIRQRSGELEDTLRRLRQMEEALRNSEKEETLEELPVIRYLRGGMENLLKQIGKLQGMTHQIQGIYDIKTMKKEDLEGYLRQMKALGTVMDESVRDSLNHLYGSGSIEAPKKDQEEVPGFRFRISDYLEKVLLGFAPRFRSTRHVVELDCPDQLEVFGDPEDYSRIFGSLVEHSLNTGLKGVQEGIIDIRVRMDGDDLVIEYWDNGRGLTAETIQELFEKPMFNRLDSDLSLQIAREIVREHLDGEFYLHNRNNGIAFEIRVPEMAEKAV